MSIRIVFALLPLILLLACTKKPAKRPFWIYTSMYKEVIAEMEPALRAKFPQVDFQWYQSGSENVAARVNAELAAGKPLADVVMTSDPYWYLELKKAGHLLTYSSPNSSKLAAHFKDGDNAFVTVRVPVAIIAYNSQLVSAQAAPTSWLNLTDPKWKGKLSMPSPLESGTSFSTVGQLVRKFGWKFFEDLRKNDILASGGNSAVINRLETQEKSIGITLLENVLDAKRKGSPIAAVYPTDGPALIPSPIAILSSTKQPELARQLYDFMLTEEAQKSIVRGRMYSPVLEVCPTDARPFRLVLASSLQWNAKVMEEIFAQRDEIKKKFISVVLN